MLKASEALEAECREVTAMLNDAMRPEALVACYADMEVGETSVSVGGHTLACGERVAEALRGSTAAAVFVATIGEEVSRRYDRLQGQSDYLQAYWLDLLANKAVDRMVREVRRRVADRASHSGLSATSHWGPGYCGWPLADQQLLLNIIPDADQLVRLTDSMLMRPMKSQAGIIGIGAGVKYHVSNCNDCQLHNCAYRNQSL